MTETVAPAEEAVSSAEAIQKAGISFRQLDHWCGLGLLKPGRTRPGVRQAEPGSGCPRYWPASEVEVARVMGLLTAAGVHVKTAHQVARSGGKRHEVVPGIMIEVTS